jgi:DNA (cytosine-5)-methyltransferase 1
MNYISLFSGGGVGDYGFVEAGLNPIVMNEIDANRAAFLQRNYPNTHIICGDIRTNIENIISNTQRLLNGNQLFLVVATPPCQGMSKNGIGTINKAIRDGKRPSNDPRTYLYSSAVEIVKRLSPKYFIIENVDRMMNTNIVTANGNVTNLVEYLVLEMDSMGYTGDVRIVNMADFGVPQNRRRTIGVFARTKQFNDNADKLFPKPILDKDNHISVNEVIEHLPPLDSKDKASASKTEFHPLHYVPVSRDELYFWIENTPAGQSAYTNNKCLKCGFESTDDDILCAKCQSLLPKPSVFVNGKYRIIKGFVSTYKRMLGNEPAPTITTRSAYACSDKNLHPTQNRVLSLYEIALLQGLDPVKYIWEIRRNGKEQIANAMLLRDILGEPLSPIYAKLLGTHLANL